MPKGTPLDKRSVNKLQNFILAHCNPDPNLSDPQGIPYALYEPGWSDIRILEESKKSIDPNITISSVSANRVSMVGPFPPRNATVSQALQITELQREVIDLQDRLKASETLVIKTLVHLNHMEKFLVTKNLGFIPLKEAPSDPKAK